MLVDCRTLPFVNPVKPMWSSTTRSDEVTGCKRTFWLFEPRVNVASIAVGSCAFDEAAWEWVYWGGVGEAGSRAGTCTLPRTGSNCPAEPRERSVRAFPSSGPGWLLGLFESRATKISLPVES